jgi:glutathione S-transferase
MLKVFGHGTSQPTRAVLWTLMMKSVPYELVKVDPVSGMDDEFKKTFPQALIPCIQDGALQIGESNAILTYLATKHSWTDLYPSALDERARIDEVLHWHHNNTRLLSGFLFRPFLFTILLKGKLPDPPKPADLKRIDRAMSVLDAWLSSAPFLAQRQRPSIADIASYCEFDQIDALAARGEQLYDFGKFPHLVAWLKRMRALPHHDAVRSTLFKTADMVTEKAREIRGSPPKAKL